MTNIFKMSAETMATDKSPAIGIDIGVSYSRVCVYQNGELKIIANEKGQSSIPSCVAFTDSQILVGQEAVDQFAVNPSNTVFGAKYLIGRHLVDHAAQVYKKYWPFTIVSESDRSMAQIQVNYKGEVRTFFPEEIVAMIMLKLKEMVELDLGTKVSEAVISVPNGYNSLQRQAIKDAAKIAGLQVLRLVNEGSATAMVYGFNDRDNGENQALIVNMGGGNFDVSIVSIEDGVFEIKSHAHSQVGGDEVDSYMVNHIAYDFKRKHKKDLKCNAIAMQRARSAGEIAKRTLSSSSETAIEIDSLYADINYRADISRAYFERECGGPLRAIIEPIDKALRAADLDVEQIRNIVLAGGSTKIPKIQKLVQGFFNGKELHLLDDPDVAVVGGAAILAAILNGDKSEAIQDILLLDVTPLSLGVETSGGEMTTIIKRQTAIPTKMSEIVKFNLGQTDERQLPIRIYEGERAMVKGNELLGTLVFDHTPTAEAESQIEVTFDIDAGSNLCVSAVDQSTNEEKSIEIVSRANCSSDRIEALRNELNQEEKNQQAKASLAEHCAKVKTAVEDILVECIEIDRGLKNNRIAKLYECIRKREQLNRKIRDFLDQNYQGNDQNLVSSTASAHINGHGSR